MEILVVVAALGATLIAGVFFAFSNFVMRALADLSEDAGVDAMNAINVTVLNPGFFLAFLGTAALCVAIAAISLLGAPVPGRAAILAACLLYLVGCVLVTGLFNVPLNDRLAGVETGSREARELWTQYRARWTRWNHVRTAASFAAAALFALAL